MQRVRISGVQGNPDLAGDRDFVPKSLATDQFSLIDTLTQQPLLSNGQPGAGGTFEQWVAVFTGGSTGKGAIAVDPTNSNIVYLSGDEGLPFLGGATMVRGNAPLLRQDAAGRPWPPLIPASHPHRLHGQQQHLPEPRTTPAVAKPSRSEDDRTVGAR